MICIYTIFKKDTDECMYVGQSSDIYGRIKTHLSGKSNTPFNKEEYYGEMIEQHFINDKNYRLDREAYWIKELNPKLNQVRNRHNSEETKQKMNEKRRYTKWINNGEITKKVNQDDLDKYIRDGWKLGRLAWKRNS